MTDRERELVRQTVRETIETLRREGMLKSADDIRYKEMTQRLFDYYREPESDPALGEAIDKLKKDDYFDIIPRYFSRRMSIEDLAGAYGCERSTIWRNKKRLVRLLTLTVKDM